MSGNPNNFTSTSTTSMTPPASPVQQQHVWNNPQSVNAPSPSPASSPERSHTPPTALLSPQRLMNAMGPLLLQSSTFCETEIRHRIRGERHGQAQNEILEENVDLRVNEEGEVNGEKVELNQKFSLSVKKDLQ